MFRTWHSCSKHDMSCAEHDCLVQNMTVMFRTWLSCSEHEHHVLNMRVMFRTRLSCSEHGFHVLNMTVMFQRVQSCSGTWKTCSGTWKSCSGFSCSGWFEQALNMLNMTKHDLNINDGSWTQFEHEISSVMFKACSAPPNMLWTC